MFLRAARGPIDFAASSIMGNKIQAGLEELTPDNLVGGYQRGVGDVAALAGVDRAEVERLLPLERLAQIEARLRTSQPRAVAAWTMHAGQFGFLDVITALTVDGRQLDIGLCLSRIAGKLRHDRHLAEPLEALGADVAELAALVEETRGLLSDRGWISAALRRRQLRRTAAVVLAMLSLASITSSIVIIRLKRDRVRDRIEAAAPCAAEAIGEGELSWASAELRKKVDDKVATCRRERAEEEARARAEAERLAEEQRVAARKAERLAGCKALADEVLATQKAATPGELGDRSRAVAGDAAPLLGRVAKRALEPADVGPTDAALPCSDTPDHARLSDAYAAALTADPLLWARRSDPSPLAERLLVAHKAELPEKALIGLADQAERLSKQGLARGEPETIAKAKRLCRLAKSLDVALHQGCAALEKL